MHAEPNDSDNILSSKTLCVSIWGGIPYNIKYKILKYENMKIWKYNIKYYNSNYMKRLILIIKS